MAYGNIGGGARPTNGSRVSSERNKGVVGSGGRQSFKMIQEVDSTNAKEIFQATETSGVADSKGKITAPQNISINNVG